MTWKYILCSTFLIINLFSLLLAQDKTINWPTFRGSHASGIAINTKVPDSWDIETKKNIKWKIIGGCRNKRQGLPQTSSSETCEELLPPG